MTRQFQMPGRSSTGGRSASLSGCSSSSVGGASVSSSAGVFGNTTSGSIPTQFMRSATSPSGTHPTWPRSPVTAERIASSAVSYGRLPTSSTSLRAPLPVLMRFPSWWTRRNGAIVTRP